MDKAVLYLRISKEDVDKINKGDDSESIINQRLLLMDYAIEHETQVVDVYSDDDYLIARMLKKSNKPVILAVNKIDDITLSANAYDYYKLGLDSDIIVCSTGSGSVLYSHLAWHHQTTRKPRRQIIHKEIKKPETVAVSGFFIQKLLWGEFLRPTSSLLR